MTMRKKDYEAIAASMRDQFISYPSDGQYADCYNGQDVVRHCAKAIADYCATQDPTFKRDRFLADCGVSHG